MKRPPEPFVPTRSLPPVPRWMRANPEAATAQSGSARPGAEDAAFLCGAALAALDPAARDEGAIGQIWRRRLALNATEAVIRLEGRTEGLAALRDTWFLRRPQDDPGPAGRRLAAWRMMAEPRALRATHWPSRVLQCFDLPDTPALNDALRGPLSTSAGGVPPMRQAARAMAGILRLGTLPPDRAPGTDSTPDGRPSRNGTALHGLALWLGDVVLAHALGWAQPLPLLPAHLPRAALRRGASAAHNTEDDSLWLAACCAGWSRGALAAITLQSDLAARSDRLRRAVPGLRGRDAKETIARLLREDAVAAQAGTHTSDRAARRLFDRLTALGVVKELTGRASFRLYGL